MYPAASVILAEYEGVLGLDFPLYLFPGEPHGVGKRLRYPDAIVAISILNNGGFLRFRHGVQACTQVCTQWFYYFCPGICKHMVADTITKEQAAKVIKKYKQDYGMGAAETLLANAIWSLFDQIDEIDLSDVELEPGEADEMFEEPFVMRGQE